MNESTLEEINTFRLNRLNVFVYSGLFAILMITLTTLVIIYSPSPDCAASPPPSDAAP